MKVRLLCLLALLPVLAPAASWEYPCPDPQAFRSDALRWINAFRASEGRTPVRLDDVLDGVSQEWADKLAGMGRLQHRSIANMKQIQGENGYGAFNENLFLGTGLPAPDAVVEAWKNSPGHRRNLLDQRIDRIGVGIAQGGPGGCVVVFNGAGGAPTPVMVPGTEAPKAEAGVTFSGNPVSRPGANQR